MNESSGIGNEDAYLWEFYTTYKGPVRAIEDRIATCCDVSDPTP
jgi:hypothetical protein